ncbi:ABC transporter permease subunit [Neptunomonas sp. XY-337]|uniref:ABC transporter permease n=1 Tax=Neptunomonas sp. XY-337 TaxID=2561897 RepID=UPI0010AA228C|nr:ABC transporter permease subunit [Neptunomonas sp. XY-337]
MHAFLKILIDFPRYVWSGWGAIASLFLLIALWELGYQHFGQLVLPAPYETALRSIDMLTHEGIWPEMQITIKRAISGFFISAALGSFLGLSAGLFSTAAMLSRPLITVFMGMPPIAWIVLAMIWFGMSDTTVIFTVVVACFPIIFIGALHGTKTLEGNLKEMAESFQAPWHIKFIDVYFPHIFSYLFPAWIAALGMSWKIVVMAELLSTTDGIGAALAITRSQLDTSGALALVMMLVASLLLIEYLIMEPIKREVEQWRE